MDYESILLVVKQVFCYQIPPRTTARGYRASDWDVDKSLWTGRLRIIEFKRECFIQLEDASTGELFASCPYSSPNAVEQVSDSSRYFVLRIVDKSSGQHAFIGIGFPERSWAFDFQVALQDFTKRLSTESSQSTKEPTPIPKLDLSLKQGQTIKISLAHQRNLPSPSSTSSSSSQLQDQNDLSNCKIYLIPLYLFF